MAGHVVTQARTIGELRAAKYEVLSVRAELRRNLIEKLRANESPFPGIHGYDETVLPQIEHAILAGQDMILLGERGQAKTRIARSLVNLLDEFTPTIVDCEINDSPFAPTCKQCRERVAQHGDATEIAWLPRERRYAEKLATPDTTIADLIGEVDPIKVAEGRYLADELTLHYGLIPRANRGIFCVNELPDLAERIQVGLLNIMEERDVQVRGYKIRLPLDVVVVASANPEDYTNRGRIITPLKDRFGALLRTHYPTTAEQELAIVEQERSRLPAEGYRVVVPGFMRELIAEFTQLARKSADISQRSGVSVRVSIANYESLEAAALARAIRLDERDAAPRVSDLPALVASTTGKIELEAAEDGREEQVVHRLLQQAVARVFGRYFSAEDFTEVLAQFDNGGTMEASNAMGSMEYVHQAARSPSLKRALAKLGAEGNPALVASGVEFVLEGLHLKRKLNKSESAAGTAYGRAR